MGGTSGTPPIFSGVGARVQIGSPHEIPFNLQSKLRKKSFILCIGRKAAPTVPEPVNMLSYMKKGLGNVIKLKTLRWELIQDNPVRCNCQGLKVLITEGVGESEEM